MAVPKKKTSPSRSRQRRSHLALKPINLVIDKDSGEYRLPHNMCMSDLTYKKRKIVADKAVIADAD